MLFSGERIEFEQADAVGIVRLFNPEQGLMDDRTESELSQVLDIVDGTPALRAIVFTGRDEGVFVRHFDVGLLERRGRQMAERGMRFTLDRLVPESPLHRCFARIEASDRVFIAAINGYCMGGGYELALACDMRYAQRGDYRIGLPEVNIGILPGAGGTQKLQRLMGPARALESMLLGRTYAPEEAARWGLINECVEQALPHALRIAHEVAGKSPRAIGHVKRLARQAGVADLATGLAEERTLFCDLMVSPDGLRLMREMVDGKRNITD
jgi:enoyl-CoA hydratase